MKDRKYFVVNIAYDQAPMRFRADDYDITDYRMLNILRAGEVVATFKQWDHIYEAEPWDKEDEVDWNTQTSQVGAPITSEGKE